METTNTTAAIWDMLADRFRKTIKAKALSPNTERGYLYTARRWSGWLVEQRLEIEPPDVRSHHIDDFIGDIIEVTSAANGAHHYRNMRVYVAWLVKRKEITTGNPMDETEPPIVPQKLIAVLTDNDHERLFEVCSGRDFLSLRDTAIMLLFMDTGLRVSELGSLGVDAVKLGERRFKVVGKGNREREVGFSSNTGLALARYLKVRAKHIRDDSISALWLNRWGRPLSVDGIKDMLNRRGEQAGISGSLHAHRYRHDFLASLEARWWQRRRAHGNWWMDNAKDGRTLWTGRQGGAGIGGARPYLAGRPDLVVRRCGDMIMVYYRYGHVTDAIAA